MIFVISALAGAKVREIMNELDRRDPLHHLESELISPRSRKDTPRNADRRKRRAGKSCVAIGAGVTAGRCGLGVPAHVSTERANSPNTTPTSPVPAAAAKQQQ